MQKKKIKCFSFVKGLKNVLEIMKDLNDLKSEHSSFSMRDEGKGSYLIVGNVTINDWKRLNLENDFMRR
jgi:hypothetical protein